jgi:hypothetical protein
MQIYRAQSLPLRGTLSPRTQAAHTVLVMVDKEVMLQCRSPTTAESPWLVMTVSAVLLPAGHPRPTSLHLRFTSLLLRLTSLRSRLTMVWPLTMTPLHREQLQTHSTRSSISGMDGLFADRMNRLEHNEGVGQSVCQLEHGIVLGSVRGLCDGYRTSQQPQCCRPLVRRLFDQSGRGECSTSRGRWCHVCALRFNLCK